MRVCREWSGIDILIILSVGKVVKNIVISNPGVSHDRF